MATNLPLPPRPQPLPQLPLPLPLLPLPLPLLPLPLTCLLLLHLPLLWIQRPPLPLPGPMPQQQWPLKCLRGADESQAAVSMSLYGQYLGLQGGGQG